MSSEMFAVLCGVCRQRWGDSFHADEIEQAPLGWCGRRNSIERHAFTINVDSLSEMELQLLLVSMEEFKVCRRDRVIWARELKGFEYWEKYVLSKRTGVCTDFD